MADGPHGPRTGVPVTVCVARGPGRVEEVDLVARDGAPISEVLEHPAVRALLPDAESAERDVGIWGRRCPVARTVAAGDRIEIYRPLRVDPMTARRERFRRQGSRAAGLFAVAARRGDGSAE